MMMMLSRLASDGGRAAHHQMAPDQAFDKDTRQPTLLRHQLTRYSSQENRGRMAGLAMFSRAPRCTKMAGEQSNDWLRALPPACMRSVLWPGSSFGRNDNHWLSTRRPLKGHRLS